MEPETALPPKSISQRIRPLLLSAFVFSLGIVVGAVSVYLYFSFSGNFQAFDYSKINWFGNSNITPTITVFENPFSQESKITPGISSEPSAQPSATPTYINPFDLVGQ